MQFGQVIVCIGGGGGSFPRAILLRPAAHRDTADDQDVDCKRKWPRLPSLVSVQEVATICTTPPLENCYPIKFYFNYHRTPFHFSSLTAQNIWMVYFQEFCKVFAISSKLEGDRFVKCQLLHEAKPSSYPKKICVHIGT